jgi:uroporphyrinogen decarboxylase
MTDRDRFVNQMHFRPVDRSFNMEFGYWEENYGQWPMFVENGVKNEREANAFFNFDPIHSVGGDVWLSPRFPHAVVSETGDKRIVMNADGLLAEVAKDGHSSIPHYTKASVVTPDDWKRCKEERMRRDDPARTVDVGKLKALFPEERTIPVGVGCGSMIGKIRDMLTFEGLAYATFDYPSMVEDMVETCCVLVEDYLDQVLPHVKFDFASGWEDICFKNGPIVSVDFFENVVVPRYKRIGTRLRAHGIDIWYTDCDGDVRPLIPGFLEGGINCLFPFEVMGGGHPGRLLDEFHGQLRIMGGFDKTQMIKGRDAIRTYMQTLAPYVERGGFIPFCDHRCPPDVTQDNYLYYLDLKERMFGMRTAQNVVRIQESGVRRNTRKTNGKRSALATDTSDLP